MFLARKGNQTVEPSPCLRPRVFAGGRFFCLLPASCPKIGFNFLRQGDGSSVFCPLLVPTDRGTVLLADRGTVRRQGDGSTVLPDGRNGKNIPGQESRRRRRRSVELAGNVFARKENQTVEPSPCLVPVSWKTRQ